MKAVFVIVIRNEIRQIQNRKTENGETYPDDVTIIDLFWERDENAIKMAE